MKTCVLLLALAAPAAALAQFNPAVIDAQNRPHKTDAPIGDLHDFAGIGERYFIKIVNISGKQLYVLREPKEGENPGEQKSHPAKDIAQKDKQWVKKQIAAAEKKRKAEAKGKKKAR